MSEQLKSCPFCGGEASSAGHGEQRRFGRDVATWLDGSLIREWFFCNCMECGASTLCCADGIGQRTRALAVAAWNRRADGDAEVKP